MALVPRPGSAKAGAIIGVKLKVKKFSEFATRVKFFNFNFFTSNRLAARRQTQDY